MFVFLTLDYLQKSIWEVEAEDEELSFIFTAQFEQSGLLEHKAGGTPVCLRDGRKTPPHLAQPCDVALVPRK